MRHIALFVVLTLDRVVWIKGDQCLKIPLLFGAVAILATQVEPHLGYLINPGRRSPFWDRCLWQYQLGYCPKSPATLPFGQVNCSERGTYHTDHSPLEYENYQ